MADTTLFPFELKDGTIINCKSADDRQLLEEARLVAEDTDDAQNYDKDRLLKMSETCATYGLGTLQRMTKALADESNG
jgi:hypothetical protein